jgi:hypothetical protein
MFDFVILISSLGSAITLLHFLHVSTLSDSYIEIIASTLDSTILLSLVT